MSMTTPNEELQARHVRVLQNFASAYAADSENGQALRAAIAALAPQAGEAHPDDAAVDAFAAAMKAKLAEARAKGRSGWQDREDCPQQFLSDLLRGHVEKGDPRDVANFCMFLHQRGEAILPAPASPQEVSDAVPLPPRCFVGLGLLKGANYEFGKVYDSPEGEFIRWADFEKYRAALKEPQP